MTTIPEEKFSSLLDAFDKTESENYLHMVLTVLNLLALYEECFPEEFARDMQQGVSILPEYCDQYSECEGKFFRMVDQHYFPLPIDALPDDIYGTRTLAEYIPIEPHYLSIDLECFDENEVPLGWLLLLFLQDERYRDVLGLHWDTEKGLAPLILREAIDYRLLRKRCEAQGGPLAHVAVALEVLTNDTQSVWLNVTLDEPDEEQWSTHAMETLRTQFQLGQQLRGQADLVFEWLEEDPDRHFSQVVRLWNACVRDTQERGTTPALVPIPGGVFLHGLTPGSLLVH